MLRKIFNTYISHFIIWTILLLLPFIGYLYEPQKLNQVNYYFIKTHCINISFLAIVYYINLHFIAPKYFFRKSRLQFIILILLVWAIYIFISFLMLKLGPNEGWRNTETRNLFFFRVIFGPSLIYSICVLTSTLMFLYNEQARQKELNKQIELEKTAAELNVLKLQISPHFLFNTLNNIRWLIRKKSEGSEEAVMKLSEILRYIIYEVAGQKVALSQEIDHLRNFIELQTLRLSVEGKVELKVDESISSYTIEPLLFIHFVENAFKYGIDSKNPPHIFIEFSKTDKGIAFHAHNKILQQKTNIQNEGIGLSNIKRRLELLYPNKHRLTIQQSPEFFTVDLDIELV